MPDDPRFGEIGKALCIGDTQAVIFLMLMLAESPPEELKVYWWQLLALTRAPEIGERPRFEIDANGRETLPTLAEDTIYPMPLQSESDERILEDFPGFAFGKGNMLSAAEITALYENAMNELPEALGGEPLFTREEVEAALLAEEAQEAQRPKGQAP